MRKYSQAANQLGFAVKYRCADGTEAKIIKSKVNESYNSWANALYEKSFLNWGLWDKKIFIEFSRFRSICSQLCELQDNNSYMLFYYLIRSLVKSNFYHKRLLDIGCGNGIGLKMASELLQAEYSLGMDLVNKLASNSYNNFYTKDAINFIQADAESIPLQSESFDIVTNLESSHLYPRVEYFFREVARILTPGGFFCYADIYINEKRQPERLENFIKNKNNLKIIQKTDITKMVQASIYKRLIEAEDIFHKNAVLRFGESTNFNTETASLAEAMGISFLPWWKIKFKNPALQFIAKGARRNNYWGKKKFFYYLVQKVKSEI